MKKRTLLPHTLTIALGQYFLNSQLAKKQLTCTKYEAGKITEEYERGRPWDKQTDLQNITTALPSGWGYQACAGSFWINSPRLKKHHYYITNQEWPHAILTPNHT